MLTKQKLNELYENTILQFYNYYCKKENKFINFTEFETKVINNTLFLLCESCGRFIIEENEDYYHFSEKRYKHKKCSNFD